MELKGADELTSRGLRKRFREVGRSRQGSRTALIQRCKAHMRATGEEDGKDSPGQEEIMASHAAENSTMVLAIETAGNEYMRSVDHNGVGPYGDTSWLVKDMHQELKSWRHPAGGSNAFILRSDRE